MFYFQSEGHSHLERIMLMNRELEIPFTRISPLEVAGICGYLYRGCHTNKFIWLLFLFLSFSFHLSYLSHLYAVLHVVLKVPLLKHSSDYILIKRKSSDLFYCLQEKGQILPIFLYSGPSMGLYIIGS